MYLLIVRVEGLYRKVLSYFKTAVTPSSFPSCHPLGRQCF